MIKQVLTGLTGKNLKNILPGEKSIDNIFAEASAYHGLNRRSDAIMPPFEADTRFISAKVKYLRHRQFLLDLEAARGTCCLEISSKKQNSRASVLVIRGRVFGCMYGRKSFKNKVFGQHAYHEALAELAHLDTVLTVRTVSEKLAFATAALYNNRTDLLVDPSFIERSLRITCDELWETKQTGCILLLDAEGLALWTIFIHQGEFLGVYSLQAGWSVDQYPFLLRLIDLTRVSKIHISVLDTYDATLLLDSSFSLMSVRGSLTLASSSPPIDDPLKLLAKHTDTPQLKHTFLDDRITASEKVPYAWGKIASHIAKNANRSPAIPHAHYIDP